MNFSSISNYNKSKFRVVKDLKELFFYKVLK